MVELTDMDLLLFLWLWWLKLSLSLAVTHECWVSPQWIWSVMRSRIYIYKWYWTQIHSQEANTNHKRAFAQGCARKSGKEREQGRGLNTAVNRWSSSDNQGWKKHREPIQHLTRQNTGFGNNKIKYRSWHFALNQDSDFPPFMSISTRVYWPVIKFNMKSGKILNLLQIYFIFSSEIGTGVNLPPEVNQQD